MKTKISGSYNHTIYASFIGYVVQAIVNNFAPLLFLTFQKEFSISLLVCSFWWIFYPPASWIVSVTGSA